jgi:hypothetical protein
MTERKQLVDVETGEVILTSVEVADTFWSRFRGLQFRRPLPLEVGLLLTPCRSIHTHWMRFSIDVAMLDGDGTVLAIASDVRPWRMLKSPAGTRSILESTAGALSGRLSVGMSLKIIGT